MATQKSIQVQDLPTTGKSVVRLTVCYFDGRGIYLNLRPCEVEPGTVRFLMTTGKSILLEKKARHSFPALKAWADKVKSDPGVYEETLSGMAKAQGFVIQRFCGDCGKPFDVPDVEDFTSAVVCDSCLEGPPDVGFACEPGVGCTPIKSESPG